MSELFADFIPSLLEFLAYFGTASVLTVVFIAIYSTATQHNEIKLIRENSPAAAAAISGSLIGFALPLTSVMLNSLSVVELVLWGIVAMIVQLAVYYVVRLSMPRISQRIESGEVAAGIWLGAASLAGGILNAASMTA
jgi:putative membrane protein